MALPVDIGHGLQARAGIGRAGAYRAGYFTVNVIIVIASVDRTGLVEMASLSITLNLNATPDTASFLIRPGAGVLPQAGQRVMIALGSADNILFGGQIKSLTREYLNLATGIQQHLRVDCIGGTMWTDRRIALVSYGSASATFIATDIIANFMPGFTSHSVAPNLPTIDQFPITNEQPSSALQRLTNLIDGGYFDDGRYDIHLFGVAGDQGPTAGTPPQPLILHGGSPRTSSPPSLKAFALTSDLSQVRTRVIVDGKSTTTPIGTPAAGQQLVINAAVPVDYLVVGGGGAGGQDPNAAAGGGAGGVVTGSYTTQAASWAIVVGAGGANTGNDGQPSNWGGFIGHGGGGGAGRDNVANGSTINGRPGGSGGGGTYYNGTAGAGTSGEGNNGGAGEPAGAAVTGDLFIVGGGGAGGTSIAGGGGGGGGGFGIWNPALAIGSYPIVIGAGGTAPGNDGAGSSALGFSRLGGGGGGNANTAGRPGGCGGGGNGQGQPGGAGSQGFGGGTGDFTVSGNTGGGGGGCGAAGGPSGGSGQGGVGGAGVLWGASGTQLYYGGGGGGRGSASLGTGGIGGGGAGGVAGTDGYGGGGGSNANGGAGVVIIGYPDNTLIATGGTITHVGGKTIHTFTASGTFTISVTSGSGGGGGGQGGPGADGTAPGKGGKGGDGFTSAISGGNLVYGGGGGGSGTQINGTGGAGGGGAAGGPGLTNTGGGGGAGAHGGSGIVILSYPDGKLSATGGTITHVGGRTIHTFTANDTFTVSTVTVPVPPSPITDLPLADASQIDPNPGTVRIGVTVFSYLRTSGPVITAGTNPQGSTLTTAAAPLDTVLNVANASSVFTATPGWVQVGGQYLRFTGVTATQLTGIPSPGYGGITSPISSGTNVAWVGALVIGSTPVLISPAVPVGAAVTQRVVLEDTAAEAALAAIEGGDGIHEHYLQDGRLSLAGARARATAELTDFKAALASAAWTTYDMNALRGRTQAITLDEGSFSLVIVRCTITFPIKNSPPRRVCEASTIRTAALLDAVVTSTE
jgi:hypothetical protein